MALVAETVEMAIEAGTNTLMSVFTPTRPENVTQAMSLSFFASTGPMATAFDRLRPYGFLILYGLMLTGLLTTVVAPAASVLFSWLL